MSPTSIRSVAAGDVSDITAIYNHYIAETIVTFEEEPVTIAEMGRRIDDVRTASLPWLIAEEGSLVKGYAYATKWRPRWGYRYSVEISVYLAPRETGRGLGSRLYDRLFALVGECRVHAVIGGIALPNEASVALHEKFGMRKVAHFEEVGFKFGRWIDVGYWQRLL